MHKKKTVSQKQLEANRRNAEKSTGPKDTRKSRFNALKHGLRCRFMLMPDENPDEFHDDLIMTLMDYEAEGPVEFRLVEMIVQSQWLQTRALTEEALLSQEAPTSDDRNRQLNLIASYRVRAERSMFRAMRELRQVQRERGKGLRTPLKDEAFLARHLHDDQATLEAFLTSPVPHFPEKPSQASLDRQDLVMRAKADILKNRLEPDSYPEDVLAEADRMLAVEGAPSEPIESGRTWEEWREYDPVTDSNYLSSDKVMYLMAKHNVTDWFEIAHLYDPSVPPPEEAPIELAKRIDLPLPAEDPARDEEQRA